MKKNGFCDFKSLEEFDSHQFVTYIYDEKSGLRGFIAIHRSVNNHPSFGATRFLNYSSEIDALRDSLRLSRAMSYKAALAGLPGGGAKAVLILNDGNINKKDLLLKEYASKVNLLSGKFVTGSDVGITKDDVKKMRRVSPYFVGTKVVPEEFTALGLLHSVKACLKQIYGSDDMAKRSFAIQGIGKVGGNLLKLLYKNTHNIFVSDIDDEKIKLAKKNYPEIRVVKPDEIYKKKVDVFSPCALSGCINYKNVHELNCKIILGGANNQLENKALAKLLHKMGILYAPDYVVNAGGLISVYEEYGKKGFSIKKIKEKVFKIGSTLDKIIKKSLQNNGSPLEISDNLAEKIFNSN